MISCIVFLFASPVWAIPGFLGLRGLPSTLDARVPTAGTGSASAWILYQAASLEDTLQFSPAYAPHLDTLLAVSDNEHYLDASIQIGYGITSEIEAAITINAQLAGYEYDQVSPRGDFIGLSDMAWGFSEIVVAGKYSYPVREDMTAAGILHVSIPFAEAFPDTAADYDGYWSDGEHMLQVRRPYIGYGGFCFGLTGAFTAVSRYVTGHANAGVTMWSQETSNPEGEKVSQSDVSIDFSLGGETATPLAVFFASVSGRIFTGRSSNPGYSSPIWADLGMRLFEDSGAWIDLMGRMGFSSYDRGEAEQDTASAMPIPGGVPGDLGIMVCMGYDLDLVASGEGTGWISGTVNDASTGASVAALISFPGLAIASITSDSISGAFRTGAFAGTIAVTAEAAGYQPASSTVLVEPGGTATIEFRLQPSQASGTVTGFVTDEATGSPVAAVLTETTSGSVATAGVNGSFSLAAPAGSRVIKAEAQGYISETMTVEVPVNGAVSASFALRKALTSGQVMSFANIYFDSGSANLKPESYPVLNEIASLLIANQGARVEIGGHTDSDGSESLNQSLSERRAASVRTYLVSRGVSSSMLTTMGYGEGSPVASNSTSEGKAQNRRIEFRVL